MAGGEQVACKTFISISQVALQLPLRSTHRSSLCCADQRQNACDSLSNTSAQKQVVCNMQLTACIWHKWRTSLACRGVDKMILVYADANDAAQFAELKTQGDLTRRAWERDVQVTAVLCTLNIVFSNSTCWQAKRMTL